MAKFDMAYCSVTESPLTTDELKEIEIKDRGRYILLKEKLFCPACQKAPLAFVHRANLFFRTYPNALHEDNCEFSQEEVTEQEAVNMIHTNIGKDEVSRQIDRLLQRLNNNNTKTAFKKIEIVLGRPSSDSGAILTRKSKYIPQKNISSALNSEDIGMHKLFYGCVFLTWEKTEGNTAGKLLIRSLDKKFLCRIIIGKQVLPYMDARLFKLSMSLCNIVFMGQLKPSNSGEYFICVLFDSRFLRVATLPSTCT